MTSSASAANRLERTLLHLCPGGRANDTNFAHEDFAGVELFLCNGKGESTDDKEGPPQINFGAIEHPDTADIEEKFPVTQVHLFPLYSRPIFPHVKVRALPRTHISASGSTNAAMDLNLKLKQALERMKLKDSNANAMIFSAAVPARKDLALKRVAVYMGPTIVTDPDFVNSLVKLRSNGDSYIAFALAKNPGVQVTGLDGVHPVGVLARIDEVSQNGSGSSKTYEVVLTVTHRVTFSGTVKEKNPLLSDRFPKVNVQELKDEVGNDTRLSRALFMSVVQKVQELCKLNHPLFQDQIQMLSFKINQRDPSELTDLCASLCFYEAPDKLQALLQEVNVNERLKRVLLLLKQEVELCKLMFENKATSVAASASGESAATSLRRLLTGGTTEKNTKAVNEFKERLKTLSVPEHAMKIIDEEMNKLSSLDPTYNATEHYNCRNYLNWLTSIPWGVYTKDNLDLNHAKKILDEDHYGLKEIKERILEFIAVASLKGNLQGKILCFVGPPGVGKTSMGKSIARALNRNFYRFSIGGMNDVAEIKGHRRTYVGALPGKFVQSLKVTKTSNPVILIDEIDKVSKRWDGDPASALLEALDPEQNNSFLDHYLDVPFDLSKILFVCTANDLSTVPKPLLDRMEIIKLSGYFLDEKMAIAKSHLLPAILNQSGVKQDQIRISDDAMSSLITQHCREAGVRSLQKHLEKIFRKIAFQIANGEKSAIVVTNENLETYVGTPKFRSDKL
eukprot:TRINITY_DN1443_c0_g1_i1.p1 TRINITY_DN1443_c0_g1~~TRINITY_DN1443_c0_g1_i1.p1  ORF type:complete len:735 (+),score=190.99 TRINITY_DN1443_c0_g1_i1:133-2337(+)